MHLDSGLPVVSANVLCCDNLSHEKRFLKCGKGDRRLDVLASRYTNIDWISPIVKRRQERHMLDIVQRRKAEFVLKTGTGSDTVVLEELARE
jgi:hypothetical protein